MSELSLLPSEPLLRQYTEVITDLYRNIIIEGNQASHFHVLFVTLKAGWPGGIDF